MSKSCAFTVCSSFLALAAFSGGCSSSSTDETVKPKLEVLDKTKSAIEMDPVEGIAGTYDATCAGHTVGTDTWSLLADGTTDLVVVKNDTACVLTMRTITTATETFVGAPAIGMDDAWQADGSAFSVVGDPEAVIRFYGNAKLDAKTFAADFLVSLLVSQSPNATDAGAKGPTGYATRTAALETTAVPASTYTISFASFGVTQDVDHVVDAVSGYAQLGLVGGTAGEDYAIVSAPLDGDSSFADVDAAFNGVPGTHGAMSDLTTLRLPATGFALPTIDLDTNPQRTVIIRHTADGVSSYQLLLVTFNPS